MTIWSAPMATILPWTFICDSAAAAFPCAANVITAIKKMESRRTIRSSVGMSDSSRHGGGASASRQYMDDPGTRLKTAIPPRWFPKAQKVGDAKNLEGVRSCFLHHSTLPPAVQLT